MTDEIHDWEPKYRKFRWTVEVPGISAFTVKKLTMENGHRWAIDFQYVNEMEIGKCPIPFRSPNATDESLRGFTDGTLKLLDERGGIIRQVKFGFVVEDYIPAVELDYVSSEFIIGRVVLWIITPPVWS